MSSVPRLDHIDIVINIYSLNPKLWVDLAYIYVCRYMPKQLIIWNGKVELVVACLWSLISPVLIF